MGWFGESETYHYREVCLIFIYKHKYVYLRQASLWRCNSHQQILNCADVYEVLLAVWFTWSYVFYCYLSSWLLGVCLRLDESKDESTFLSGNLINNTNYGCFCFQDDLLVNAEVATCSWKCLHTQLYTQCSKAMVCLAVITDQVQFS